MNKLNGWRIDEEFLPKFEWVKDLQYFDGPITSQYKTTAGENYVFHWCDAAGKLNRWIAVRVSTRSLLELTSGVISIYELLTEKNQERAPLIIDISEEAKMEEARYVHLEDLPESYLPEEDALLDPDFYTESDDHIYPLLLDGDWETDDLGEVQRRFYDVYSMHYTAKDEQVQLPKSPMRGGYSFVNLYNLLKSHIPNIHMPRMNAVHYASPGYIKFDAKRTVSLEVKKHVDLYIVNRNTIYRSYQLIGEYIKLEGLNDEGRAPLTYEQSQRLTVLAKNMMQFFDSPSWEWIMNNTQDEFKAAKIARSYCKRLDYFSRLIHEKKLKFAEI